MYITIHINNSFSQKWPEDALKKSADYVFEEINAARQVKKTVSKIGMDIFEKAM